MAQRRGRERFVCEQPPYSMLIRGIEADVLPTCGRYGMGVIPWSPLGGGWLSGQWRKGAEPPQSSRAERLPQRFDLSIPGNQAKLEAAEQLAQLADEAGMTLIEMALAFVINHPAVTAAIIGPRTMEQLESQLTRGGRHAVATTCSTRSTRSCRPDRTSTPATPAGRTRRSSRPPDVAQCRDPGVRRGRRRPVASTPGSGH